MKAIWRPTAKQLETMTGKEVYDAMRNVLETWKEVYSEWEVKAVESGKEENDDRYSYKKCALTVVLEMTEIKEGEQNP